MKEYLNKETHEFVRSHSELNDMWIEIPEGANFAAFNQALNNYYFNEENIYIPDYVIWQRHQEETLNDKVASAECFRKSFAPNSNEIAKAIVFSLNDEDKFLNEVESNLIDNVNHPSHYASGEIECIDAMRAMLGRERFIGYIRGNMFKYQWRYQNKNGIEDLKKSEWYLNKLLEVENEL